MRAIWPLACTIFVMTVAGLAGSISTASARPALTCSQPAAASIVEINVVHPLKNYLLGIGQAWWHKDLIPFPGGHLCGTHSDKQAATRLKRFYVLLQAFPARPNRAQWNARFKPLIDAAIRFDYWIVVTAGPYADGSYPGADLAWLRSIRNSPYGTNLQ